MILKIKVWEQAQLLFNFTSFYTLLNEIGTRTGKDRDFLDTYRRQKSKGVGNMNAGIIGIGRYLPEKILTNQDLEKIMDTT